MSPRIAPPSQGTTGISCTDAFPVRKVLPLAIISERSALEAGTGDLGEHRQDVYGLADQLRMVIANISEGVCLYDADEHLVLCNARYAEILGIPHDILRRGTPFATVLQATFRLAPGPRSLDGGLSVPPEKAVVHPLGTDREAFIGHRVVSIRKRSLPGGGWISTLDDITERRRLEDRLLRLARHDDLTGLANRATFIERLDVVMRQAPTPEPLALLYLDLDHFKPINDELGHQAGDTVLQIVAERLSTQICEQDLAARFGGDEFAVLLGCGKRLNVDDVARRLIAEIRQPIQVGDLQVAVGVSIGIASAPEHGTTPAILLSNADRALYSAKKKGRNCYWRYGSEPKENSVR